jgi:hypothetical protein
VFTQAQLIDRVSAVLGPDEQVRRVLLGRRDAPADNGTETRLIALTDSATLIIRSRLGLFAWSAKPHHVEETAPRLPELADASLPGAGSGRWSAPVKIGKYEYRLLRKIG